MERIYHLALRRDWEAAQRAGEYRVSTVGRTLDEEGFVHASFGHQWPEVRNRYYAELEEPLVLLEIDPDLVDAPVVVEVPDGAREAFPHIYGPLAPRAVVRVTELS